MLKGQTGSAGRCEQAKRGNGAAGGIAAAAVVLLFGMAVFASRPAGAKTESNAVEAQPVGGGGRIEIAVTDGRGGPIAPVMVSPRCLADGKHYAPENPVDLTPQWDAQGRSGPQRQAWLGAALKGPVWCSRGPIALDAKPGAWEVLIRCGIEYVPHTEKLEVAAGKTAQASVALERWVDMRRLGWWSGDDHVHAQLLSEPEAQNLLTWAKAEDTSMINVVKMGDIKRTWFEQRGWGKKYRVSANDYALVPGQECPRTHQELGHTLALNLAHHMVRDTSRYFLYDYQFDGTREQGGLVGYAHVNSGSFFVHRDMSINVPRNKVDFVELLQFGRMDPALYYEFLNLGLRLTASAGSDVPWGGSIGESRVYAYTGRTNGLAIDDWYDAVRRGRTFVTNGPMVEFRVEDAMPGATLHATKGQQLRVRAKAWGHARVGAPQRLEIVQFGKAIQSTAAAQAPAGTGKDAVGELKLDFLVDAADGFWIAARVAGFDGTHAHTTPVWVVRNGLVPWNYADVGRLLDKRLASLREVESLYEKRKANPDDDFVKQWPELAKRVAEARKIYEDLKQVAVKEKPLRNS